MGIIGEIVAGSIVYAPLVIVIVSVLRGFFDVENYGEPKRDYITEYTVYLIVIICVCHTLLKVVGGL